MGTNIIVKNTSFLASAIEFDAAVSSGLQGLYFPIGAAADVGRNFAAGGKDASLVGLPVTADGGFRFGPSAYLDTGLSESAEMTYLIIGKTPDDASSASKRPYYIGSYGSPNEASLGNGSGAVIGIGGSATVLLGNAAHFNDAASSTITTGSRTIAMAAGALNSWKMMALTADNTSNKLRQLTDNLSSLDTTYPYGRTKATGKIRIGTAYSSSGLGNADIACAAIYNRVLSEAELAALHAQLSGVMRSYIGVVT